VHKYLRGEREQILRHPVKAVEEEEAWRDVKHFQERTAELQIPRLRSG
jgi:hypothetical protein